MLSTVVMKHGLFIVSIYCMTIKFGGNLFWQIGHFEGNPPIFPPAKFLSMMSSLCDIINMWSTIAQNVHTKASNFERMERK